MCTLEDAALMTKPEDFEISLVVRAPGARAEIEHAREDVSKDEGDHARDAARSVPSRSSPGARADSTGRRCAVAIAASDAVLHTSGFSHHTRR